MMLRSLILFLLILPTFAAENIKAVGAVSKANVKAIGAVAEANVKAFGVVDNTGGGGGGSVTPDGEANVGSAIGAVNTITLNSKTTAGANRVGVVHVGWNDEGTAISSITWNGVAMTLGVSTNNLTAGMRASLYRIINPPTAAANIVITWTGAISGGYAIASSYHTVNQTTPFSGFAVANSTGGGVAGPATLNITSATGQLVVDAIGFADFDASTATAGAGQTEVGKGAGATFWFGGGSREDGAGTVTMSWTYASGGGHWALVAGSLQPP